MGTIPSYPSPEGPLDGAELIPAWKDGAQIAIPAVALFGDSPAIAVEQATIATAQAALAGTRAMAADGRARDAAASAAAAAALFSGAAAPGGAALIGTSTGQTVQAAFDAQTTALGQRPRMIAARADLAALAPILGVAVFLLELGREGQFVCRAGNAPADPLQGLYVASATPNFYWARIWDNVGARPEWWGAVQGSYDSDCEPAITAALTVAGTALLATGDYYCANPPTGYGNGRRLFGAGVPRDAANNRGTGIVIKSASAHGVIMGLQSPPLKGDGTVDPNGLATGIEVRGVEMRRDRAPSIADAGCGILIKNTVGAVVERPGTREFMIGIGIVGTIDTFVSHPSSTRTLAGTGPGADYFKSVALMTDPTNPLNPINGNASVRVEYPIASAGVGFTGTSYAVYLDGRFTDTTLKSVATSAIDIPISINGDALTHDGDFNLRTNSNVVILDPILDQFGTAGISITNLNKFGSVRIGGDDAYFGALASAIACLQLTNTMGSVSVESGEMALAVGTTCFGISGENVRKLYLGRGLRVHEAGNRGASFNNLSQSRIECQFDNESRAANQAVLAGGNCDSNVFAPSTTGMAGGFGFAVALLGNAHTNTTVDGAGVSAGTCNNKLYNDTASITADGPFGPSNRARGIA